MRIHPASIVSLTNLIAFRHGWWWDFPLRNSTEDGHVLEWWNGQKKLTIYVGQEAEYIKVPSADMDEMVAGTIRNPKDLVELWRWIAN